MRYLSSHIASVRLGIVLAFIIMVGTEAFLDRAGRRGPQVAKISTSSLFYTNYTLQVDAHQMHRTESSSRTLEIPVIGPLLNVPKPLIIGESMWLNPPTPLQWKTIETCVEAQKLSIEHQQSNTPTTDRPNDTTVHTHSLENMATIDQSPLVAVLHKDGKDFATIAAIVGIVTKEGSIDTTSAESFRESLAMLHTPYYSDHSRVRLVGIGRAKLTNFVVRHPNENEGDDTLIHEPLLMAQMELLLDSNEHGKASSPVHALNRLSMLTSRIRFLHQDRQQIVRGLQAAQARLEMAMEDWQDYDGIGAVFAGQDDPLGRENENSNVDLQMTLHSFLQEFNQDTNTDHMASSRPLTPTAAMCLTMDNFGLGVSPTAYADLMPMSEFLVERLQPFYSPQRWDTEEFAYEAFSWVALESLKFYLPSETISEALQSSNTYQRLEVLYHAMMNHKQDLTVLAKAKSQELLDCGEECTGLF
ncbi:hypothetical protein IV203_015336 [Nitzschia inconspicua]|uniref:Uncharacterized protein n=1 Tax=Nitzschia inconspicua TaxID=303405 RepID=A0A9K3LAT7_9STRA|nr:hypothetical protein IV203_015336 [Nitzschia inconspicua]